MGTRWFFQWRADVVRFNARDRRKRLRSSPIRGCYYNLLPPEASLKTPGILIAGELDTAVRRDNIRSLFDNNRAEAHCGLG